MSLLDKAKKDQENEHAKKGGGWFKFKEGDNRLRILVEPIAIFEDYNLGICYTACGFTGNIKYLTFVYDFADNQIKLWKMPYGLFQDLAGLETDEDFAFSEFPMPYGLNIKAKDAGTKEVKYTLIPSPKRVPLPEYVMTEISKKADDLPKIIETMKKKNEEEHKANGMYEKLHAKGNTAPADASNVEYPVNNLGEASF